MLARRIDRRGRGRCKLQDWAREHGVVADSEPMRRALQAVQTAATTNASVLIEGETGVGKRCSPAPYIRS